MEASLWPTQTESLSGGARIPSGGPRAKWPNLCSQDSWACHQLSRCPGNLQTLSVVSTTSPGATRSGGQRNGWGSTFCGPFDLPAVGRVSQGHGTGSLLVLNGPDPQLCSVTRSVRLPRQSLPRSTRHKRGGHEWSPRWGPNLTWFLIFLGIEEEGSFIPTCGPRNPWLCWGVRGGAREAPDLREDRQGSDRCPLPTCNHRMPTECCRDAVEAPGPRAGRILGRWLYCPEGFQPCGK